LDKFFSWFAASDTIWRAPPAINDRGILASKAARAPPTTGATAAAAAGALLETTAAAVFAIAGAFLRSSTDASESCLETAFKASATDFADFTAFLIELPVAATAAGEGVTSTVFSEGKPNRLFIALYQLLRKKMKSVPFVDLYKIK
jgi:hypothetical protein